ncbi:hypothetical protein PGB90_002107 [Kerria lacca]
MIRPIFILFVFYFVDGRGPHHPAAGRRHYHPQPKSHKNILSDEEILHDKRHISEDLGDWSDQYAQLTDEEIEFRYFKVHDLDNNTKLDGVEIYQAIKHSMDMSSNSYEDREWEEKESTIIDLIDQVLMEDDTNNDGYLSYAEYIIGRQKQKTKMN